MNLKTLCLFLAAAVVPASAFGQYTTITASHIQSSVSGTPLANGYLCLTPVDANGFPASFTVGGGGGQVAPTQTCFPVTSGTISGVSVADTSLLSPQGIGYQVQVQSTAHTPIYTYPQAIFPQGMTWNLDAWSSILGSNAQIFYATTAPTGACLKASMEYVPGGQIYGCVNGAWAPIGGGTCTGSGCSGLPTASGAGYAPVSTGPGLTYAPQLLGSAAYDAASAFDAAGTAAAALAAALQKTNNLSDLASASTARANLGLGSAAVANTSAFDEAGTAAAAVAGLAPLSSPALTGTPTTPTPTSNITTGQIINAAWVNSYFLPLIGGTITGSLSIGGSGSPTITATVPIIVANGLTGIPLPVNTSDVANKAYVDASVAGAGGLPSASGPGYAPVSTSAGTSYTPTLLGSAAYDAASAFDASGAATTALAAALVKANNLSDLPNASTARTNLGLGSAAVANTSAFDAAGTAAAVVAGLPVLPTASAAGQTIASNAAGTAYSNISYTGLSQSGTLQTSVGIPAGTYTVQSGGAIFAILAQGTVIETILGMPASFPTLTNGAALTCTAGCTSFPGSVTIVSSTQAGSQAMLGAPGGFYNQMMANDGYGGNNPNSVDYQANANSTINIGARNNSNNVATPLLDPSGTAVNCGNGNIVQMGAATHGSSVDIYPSMWPSSCTAVTQFTCTTSYDCAVGWAAQQLTGTAKPCRMFVIHLDGSNGSTGYASYRAFNTQSETCTSPNGINHQIAWKGPGPNGAVVQVYPTGWAGGGTNGIQLLDQFGNPAQAMIEQYSATPSSAFIDGVFFQSMAGYNSHYGCIQKAGFQQTHDKDFTCFNFNQPNLDGMFNGPGSLGTATLNNWQSAEIQYGGPNKGQSDNNHTENITVTNTGNLNQAVIVPTLGTFSLHLPSVYTGGTQVWPNGYASLSYNQTCGAEGYIPGTGSYPCYGQVLNTGSITVSNSVPTGSYTITVNGQTAAALGYGTTKIYVSSPVFPSGLAAGQSITGTGSFPTGTTIAASTCNPAGSNPGTGSQNCFAPPNAVYVSPYLDGSGVTSTNGGSTWTGSGLTSSTYYVGKTYNFDPKLVLTGNKSYLMDRVLGRFLGSVPNFDSRVNRGTSTIGNAMNFHERYESCGTEPSYDLNGYALWGGNTTNTLGQVISSSSGFILEPNPLYLSTSWPMLSAFVGQNGGVAGTPTIDYAGTNLIRPDYFVSGQTDYPSRTHYGFLIALVGKTQPGYVPTTWVSTTTYTTQTVSWAAHFWTATGVAGNLNQPPPSSGTSGNTYWSLYSGSAIDATFVPTINSSGQLSGLTQLAETSSATGYSTSNYAIATTQIVKLNAGGGVEMTFISRGPGADCSPTANALVADLPDQDFGMYRGMTDGESVNDTPIASGLLACMIDPSSYVHLHDHPQYCVNGIVTSAGQYAEGEDDSQYRKWMSVLNDSNVTEVHTEHFTNFQVMSPSIKTFQNKIDYQLELEPLKQSPGYFGSFHASLSFANDVYNSQQLEGGYHQFFGDSGPADEGYCSGTTGGALGNINIQESSSGAPSIAPMNFNMLFTTNACSPNPFLIFAAPTINVTNPVQTFALTGLTGPFWEFGGPGDFPFGAGPTLNVSGGIGSTNSDAPGVYFSSTSLTTSTGIAGTQGTPNATHAFIDIEDTATLATRKITYEVPYTKGGPITLAGTGLTFPSNNYNATLSLTQGTSFSIPLTASCPASGYTATCVAPYNYFTVGPNALPAGLHLTADGILGGNPSATGTFTFTIAVQDATAVPNSSNGNISVIDVVATIAAGTANPLGSSCPSATSTTCIALDAPGTVMIESATEPGQSVSSGIVLPSTIGSVSNVNMTVPTWMTVAGIPITGSGTVVLGTASQAQNLVLASPATAAGTLGPRALVAADLPASITSNTSGLAAGLSGAPALPSGTTGTTQASSDTSNDLATDAFVHNVAASAGAGTGTPPWLQYLGTGADGAYSLTTGSANLSGVKYYTTFNVSSGATLTVNSNLGLTIHATGACTINGTINARGLDNTSNQGVGGGSSGGGGGGSGAGNAGTSTTLNGGTLGSGGAGSAGVLTGGAGGNASTGTSSFTRAVAASGGGMDGEFFSGTKGGAGGTSGGAGGVGGEGVTLICGLIAGTGTIDTSAAYGNPPTANSSGAGGGGGGGPIILSSQATITSTPNLFSAPGAGAVSTVPEAVGYGGSCTTPPVATLGVTGGALSGTYTVSSVGAGCGTGTDVNFAILGGGGTLGTGTFTCTFTSGAITSSSCTVTPGTSSGFTSTTYTTSGAGGNGAPGWNAVFQSW